jgi:hypothetical protein
MDGGMLGGLLCGLVIALLVGTLIGAVFLRAAIALFNKMAGASGPPAGVPEPPFGRAMGITFVTSLVNWVVGFVIGLATGAGAQAAGPDGAKGVNLLAQAASVPAGLLVMALMLTALLPTSFGKAVLVTLLYLVIVALVVGVIVGVLVAVGLFALRAA